MTDHATLRCWMFRALWVGIAAMLIFAKLLPLDLSPGRFPGPDLTLALCFAWVLRRPDYVPAILVVGVFFLSGMLFHETPGVWPLMVLAGSEFLRNREPSLREQPFLVEYGLVVGTLVLMVLGQRLMLAIFFVEQVSFGRSLLFLLSTTISYPFVVAISVFVLGVQKRQPGEHDNLGIHT